ncbi:MAG: cation diffusion facilitator family transporter [Bdellovibrionales bacterium]|nr:cation diffusion facilitator family transporter [Bdellovibrionales bacterium]
MNNTESNLTGSKPINLAVISTFLSLFPTFYVWWISNSTALFADLLRSSSEFSAILVSWLILRGIDRRKWKGFSYGFAKIEQLSCLIVGATLFISFTIVLIHAAQRFYYPVIPENITAGIVMSVLSILGNSFIWIKNIKLYQKKPSPVIDSQKKLFRAKTFACTIVFFTLVLTHLLSQELAIYVDPLGSLLIAFFMFKNAVAITNSSLDDLLDRSIEEKYQIIILKALIKFESEYKGLQKIRTRRHGIDFQIEIFLELDGNRSLADIDESIGKIKKDIGLEIPNAEIVFIYNVH